MGWPGGPWIAGKAVVPVAFVWAIPGLEQAEPATLSSMAACVPVRASVCLWPPAPELLEQKPYGKAVDVWALGVISYIL